MDANGGSNAGVYRRGVYMTFNPEHEYGNMGFLTVEDAIIDAQKILPRGTKYKIIYQEDIDPTLHISRGIILCWYYGKKESFRSAVVEEAYI